MFVFVSAFQDKHSSCKYENTAGGKPASRNLKRRNGDSFASKMMNRVEISGRGEEEKFESNRRLFLARNPFSRRLSIFPGGARDVAHVRARHRVISSDRSSLRALLLVHISFFHSVRCHTEKSN